MALYISASLIRLSLTNLMSSGVTVNNSLPSLFKTDNVVFFRPSHLTQYRRNPWQL